ncbi:ABC-2 transporter permease [Fredinandcohnia sp. 179-A 10B2 NHS]|uniref:ABC-2 transporter permease n=1 Tax=Fredinandcohnia sp. 179-A 10B2 NHS TaxID=3235176 RepID=UPI00399FCB5F
MFTKALWLRNYKQAKFIVWGLWAACLYFVYAFYNFIKVQEYSLHHWNEWGNKTEAFHFYFGNFFEVAFFQIIALILLASVLVGLERTNQSLDFTLSMPYKRRDIFYAKWAFGVVHLSAALTVSVLLSIFILVSSEIHEYLPVSALGYYYLIALVTLIGVYTFSLLFGLIGASIVSQFAFSIIFLALPYGFYNLVFNGISLHYRALTGSFLIRENFGLQNLDKFFEYFSFPILLFEVEYGINEIYVWNQSTFYEQLLALIIPVIVTVLSLYLINLLSNSMRSENNGKILAYQGLLPYLKIGVFICFYLFGGLVIGGASYGYDETPSIVSYHLGGLGFSIVAYFILSKLAGMRIQFGRNK